MSLLARYAEHLFWLSRYAERAASLARIIETHAACNPSMQEKTSWAWLVKLHADDNNFAKEHLEASARNVLNFYIRDLNNIGSILFAVHASRENARALRAILPTEMWSQLNGFYNKLRSIRESDIDPIRLSRTCSAIKMGCRDQFGIAESMLYRDEGWRFYQLGRFSERGSQTSRVLDVRFAQLATNEGRDQDSKDARLWQPILRSAAAYQAYIRLGQGSMDAEHIARFLILNQSHPGSIAFCCSCIEHQLHKLRIGFNLTPASPLRERLAELASYLRAVNRCQDLVSEVHDISCGLQRHFDDITRALAASYFNIVPDSQKQFADGNPAAARCYTETPSRANCHT